MTLINKADFVEPYIFSATCSEENMLELANKIGAQLSPPLVIFLKGEMGAGKTTFTRGLLAGLGFFGKVKSPTYTLVEPYMLNNTAVFHFDFFRLKDEAETEFLGLEDYFTADAICIVEWSEKIVRVLPEPDLVIEFKLTQSSQAQMIEPYFSESDSSQSTLKDVKQTTMGDASFFNRNIRIQVMSERVKNICFKV